MAKSNWIKEQMDIRGVSIDEMAEITGLSRNTIRNYYHGYNKPGKKIRLNMIKIFDLDEDEVEG